MTDSSTLQPAEPAACSLSGAATAGSPTPASFKVGIGSISDVVFGLALSIGSLILVARTPQNGSSLVLGPEVVEQARRSLEGTGLAPRVEVGDTVSLHWDWVCDRLSPAGVACLEYCTATNLAAVNALATPGPAVACDA